MIYKQSLSGRRRRFGQLAAAGQHINERRLAHITASDKRILMTHLTRTLGVGSVGYSETCRIDYHNLFLQLFKSSVHDETPGNGKLSARPLSDASPKITL